MRLGFALTVIVSALLLYRFMDSAAVASPVVITQKHRLPMDVSFERMQARTELNSIREAMQMQALTANEQLDAAAQAHADYLVVNHASSHDEIEGKPLFTGVKPLDRALFAGYNASYVSENLSTKNENARSSVDGLFSAIYHRFGFLNPGIDELGVGTAQDEEHTDNSAFVYVMGNSELNHLCTLKNFNGVGRYIYGVCRDKKHRIAEKKFQHALNVNKMSNPEIILYPYDGQVEVPPAFYAEVPDPLPNYDVSGFPVSIEFNDYFFKEVILHSFELFRESELISNVLLMDKSNDPHRKFTDKQFALFPLERLEYNSEYKAVVTYSTKGQTKKISWTFRTRIPTEKLHTITQKEEEITIDPAQSHMFYFKPLNAHDVVKNVQFPSSVDIEFIDNNTFKVTVNDDSLGHLEIKSDKRILHVDVNSQ